ncbi:LysR family transcriptional regulator [Paraburkholderia sp. LEh10]|jgi:DNA-binding transcriptional LysR family regulator|uniref:LysR family transcriptional regulator n=1 Tax=Paraburkholderia sp. LEh10 TaxID=2821353 RepID=UPI001AE9901B|nr:LysR family transcriptional regulator [Paraburkholderia sp. LEh10]MBP0593694.1 LysR family transcriptional regulator [Paraburkholderia sp. LEh10]
MHPEFNVDLLRTFVAVVEAGSFTKAAVTVHRSQAAVSMQIKRLEQMLGTTLFARDTRNLSLTRPGNTLLEYARRVIDLHEEAWSAIVRPEVKGRVVLGAPDDYVSSLLSPVLRRFSNLYPHVEIEIVCAQSTALAPMLADNKIDLAFVTRDRKLRGEFVRSEPMVWVGASADTPVLKLSPLPVGLYEPGCVARANTLAALDRARIRYRAAYSSASLSGLVATVDAGLSVIALARCSVPSRLAILGAEHGLPVIEPLDIVVARSAKSDRPTCDYLAAQMVQDLAVRTSARETRETRARA